MANGDAAAAQGLHTVPDTQPVNKGADNHNIRGDELAAERIARANQDSSLSTSIAAVASALATEKTDRANQDAALSESITTIANSKFDNSRIRIQAGQPATIAGVSGRIWFEPV